MIDFLLILAPSFLLGVLIKNPDFWWAFAPIAFIVGAWRGKAGWQAFLAGFGAIAILWLGVAAFYDTQGGGRLTERMAQNFVLFGSPSSYDLYFISCLLGGLIGGFAALSGFRLKKLFARKSRY